ALRLLTAPATPYPSSLSLHDALPILFRSLWQTVLATSLVIVVAYPIAFYITTRPAHLRPLMLLLVVAPSWTNQVIRAIGWMNIRSEEHTSELQSRFDLVCRLLLEKKK